MPPSYCFMASALFALRFSLCSSVFLFKFCNGLKGPHSVEIQICFGFVLEMTSLQFLTPSANLKSQPFQCEHLIADPSPFCLITSSERTLAGLHATSTSITRESSRACHAASGVLWENSPLSLLCSWPVIVLYRSSGKSSPKLLDSCSSWSSASSSRRC